SAASPIQLYLLRSCSALTALYSLSLHDALPIFKQPNVFSIHGSFDSSQREALETKLSQQAGEDARRRADRLAGAQGVKISTVFRSEEHTSELQSRENLVCRPLLEKKKT